LSALFRRQAHAAPPREVPAGPLTLLAFAGDEARELSQLVTANLEHLRPWMPWAQEPPSEAAQAEFVTRSIAEWDGGQNFGYWMREDATGAMVGCTGLHARAGAGTLEIGYWVSESRVRRGYATAAARALTEAALTVPGVVRVEIHCDEANVASAAVPRRLGYHLVRVEDRPAEAPGETGRHQVWAVDAAAWAATLASAPS
jgi:RimJ/RimL family protein N-acetyltransferase